MTSKRSPSAVILALIMLLLAPFTVTACSSGEKKPAEQKDQVSIQLSWVNTMEFAGFYVAKEKGYYNEQKLDTTLLTGGFDADGSYISPIAQVTSGKADFGVASGDLLLTARAEGQPLVAVAAIYQLSPVIFFSLADQNITRPQDLVGKTVGIDLDTATGTVYRALLASQNIAFEEVNTVPRTSFDSSQLLNDEVDVLDGFVTNQPVLLRREGRNINMILASDYGISVYNNVIFTTEDMIADRPEMVERFLRATFKGYETAVANPADATHTAKPYLALTYGESFDLQNETEVMQTSLPLIKPAGSEVGMMTADAWKVTEDILLDQKLLSAPLDLDKAFNLSFVDKIYGR